MDGRPIRASKCAANGAKNTGSSSSASTRPNSAGNTNSSDGKIASHNVGWSLTVLSTMASIPSIPRVRGHPPGSAPSDPGSTRRLFQVEVATKALVVSCRLKWEKSQLSGKQLGDGVLTSRETFQHLFSTSELRRLVEAET